MRYLLKGFIGSRWHFLWSLTPVASHRILTGQLPLGSRTKWFKVFSSSATPVIINDMRVMLREQQEELLFLSEVDEYLNYLRLI